MTKPTVHFQGEAEFYNTNGASDEDIGDWTYARVYALDHPVLGRGDVRTSQVLQRHDDGSFETRNTIYKPRPE